MDAVDTVGCFLIYPLTRVVVSRACTIPVCCGHIVHQRLEIFLIDLRLSAYTLRRVNIVRHSLLCAQKVNRHLFPLTRVREAISLFNDVWSEYLSLATYSVLIL